jgi:hypothetical protein
MFLEVATNTCSLCTSSANYQYVDVTVNKCGVCDPSCSGCHNTATNCMACAPGAEIVSTLPGPCRSLTSINFDVTLAENCGDNYQQFCYWIEPSVPVPTPVLEDLIRLGNIRSVIKKTEFSSSQLVESELTLSIHSESSLLAKVKVSNVVLEEYYVIIILLDKDSDIINDGGRQYQYLHFFHPIPIHHPLTQSTIDNNKRLGTAISGFANLNPNGNYYSGETFSFMATIDPNGIVTRFFQSIKIVSRLAYFDFYWGPGLNVFLESADSSSGVIKATRDAEALGRRVGTKARLTQYKVGVEVINTIYTWKVGCYSLSMIISALISIVQYQRKQRGICLLWLVYIWPRVHIILLNFCLVDICFMGSRIFLHSNNRWQVFLCGLIIMFVWIDICRIMDLALNDHIWSEIYKEKVWEKQNLNGKLGSKIKNNKRPDKKVMGLGSGSTRSIYKSNGVGNSMLSMGELSDSRAKPEGIANAGSIHPISSGKRLLRTRNNNPSGASLHRHSEGIRTFRPVSETSIQMNVSSKSILPKRNPSSSNLSTVSINPADIPQPIFNQQNKIIDYDRTYDEIELNHHLVSVSSSSLMISQKVYMSAACRLHLTVHSFRVGFYQFFMVAGQGCPRLMACCILVLELAKIIRSIYLYCKLKYLKSKVLLAIDLSQSLYMAVFFSIFLFAPLREDYVPAAGLQNLAMWLVVLTCLTEYILLGTFLLISAIDLVKKLWLVRNLKQKGLYVEPPHSFLRYQEAGSFRSPANNFIKSSAREGTRGNGTSNDIHEGASSKGSRTKFTSIQQAKVAPININNEDNPSQDGKESVASSHKKDHLISNAKNLGSNNLIPTVSVHSKPRKSIQIADSSERVVIVHSNQMKQSTSSPSHSPVIKPKIIVPKAKQQPNSSSTVMKLSQDSVEDPGHKSPQDSHSPTVQKAFFPESEALDNGKNAGMGYNSGAISTYPLDNPDALHPERLDRRGSTYKFRRSSQMLKEANPVDMEDRRPSN